MAPRHGDSGRHTSHRIGRNGVWVATGNGRLSRIDPKTTTIVASIPVGSSPVAIAADASVVWVASGAGELFQVDPATNTLVRSVRLGHSSQASP